MPEVWRLIREDQGVQTPDEPVRSKSEHIQYEALVDEQSSEQPDPEPDA